MVDVIENIASGASFPFLCWCCCKGAVFETHVCYCSYAATSKYVECSRESEIRQKVTYCPSQKKKCSDKTINTS